MMSPEPYKTTGLPRDREACLECCRWLAIFSTHWRLPTPHGTFAPFCSAAHALRWHVRTELHTVLP